MSHAPIDAASTPNLPALPDTQQRCGVQRLHSRAISKRVPFAGAVSVR